MGNSRISWPAIAGVFLVLCGCGSSSSAPVGAGATQVSTAAAGAPAHGRYIARADDVCRAGDAAIAPINTRGAEIERHNQAAAAAAQLVPVLREGLHDYREFLVRLRRIAPPAEDRAAVAGILAGLKKVGGDLERLTGALERGELEKVRTITAEREMDRDRVSVQELEFGFKVCGEPVTRSSVSG